MLPQKTPLQASAGSNPTDGKGGPGSKTRSGGATEARERRQHYDSHRPPGDSANREAPEEGVAVGRPGKPMAD